ncbi:hypothetical protein, partial [Burkholderia pseudomallei]|uniref:hypothetical protein n=1 Tax=Burkholderia pseudomallei TaxID=28450 RepID=UPI00195541A4
LPPDPSMPKDSSEPHSFSPREKSPRYRPLGTHRHYRADSADSVDEQTVHRRASAHIVIVVAHVLYTCTHVQRGIRIVRVGHAAFRMS